MNEWISIIIVNYNGKHYLSDCLSSLLTECTLACEIIVVDNGSSDGSVEFLHSSFPTVVVIESKHNLGFAGGNNLGVQNAKGEYIVLLNNDTKVRPGWLKGLVDALADERVACASSLIKTEGIPERYYEKNGSINFLGHNIMRIFNEPNDIFFAGGASMIFRKSIVGVPFDPDYFLYAEDVYLGLRMRFKGYRVCHTNNSVVDHVGNGTSRAQRGILLTYYQERNRLLNTVIFFSPITLLKIIPFLAANVIAKMAAAAAGKKYSLVGLVHAYAWFFVNISAIRKKRAERSTEKAVHENEVIRWMTGQLTNGESTIGRMINAAALFYCKIVQLNVIEIHE